MSTTKLYEHYSLKIGLNILCNIILVAIVGSEDNSPEKSNFYNLDFLKKVIIDELITTHTDYGYLNFTVDIYPDRTFRIMKIFLML